MWKPFSLIRSYEQTVAYFPDTYRLYKVSVSVTTIQVLQVIKKKSYHINLTVNLFGYRQFAL